MIQFCPIQLFSLSMFNLWLKQNTIKGAPVEFKIHSPYQEMRIMSKCYDSFLKGFRSSVFKNPLIPLKEIFKADKTSLVIINIFSIILIIQYLDRNDKIMLMINSRISAQFKKNKTFWVGKYLCSLKGIMPNPPNYISDNCSKTNSWSLELVPSFYL